MRIAITILLCCLTAANSAIHPAASVAQSDVQAAIDLCSANGGDIVTIPAGTATYNSEVDILNKGVWIIGAGIDQTVIKRGSSLGAGNSPIFVRGYPSNVTWLTAMTVSQDLGSTYGGVQIESRDHLDRRPYCFVSSMKFTITGGSGTRRTINYIGTDGLIWNSQFALTNAGSAAWPEADADGGQTSSNSFFTAMSIGSTNCLIVEDSWFYADSNSEGTDVYNGRQMTVRYCMITNGALGDHGGDSGHYSSFVKEWYMNHSYENAGTTPWAMQMRGGTGVIWSNFVHWSGGFRLILYRASDSYTNCPGGCGAPKGQVDDGNFDITYPGSGFPKGYPLLTQHGWGSFTNALPNCTSGCTSNNYQQIAPIYSWGNSNSASANLNPNFEVLGYDGTPNDATNYVKLNREYYYAAMPGYTPWTYPDPRRATFEGAGGGPPTPVVVGTLSGQITIPRSGVTIR